VFASHGQERSRLSASDDRHSLARTFAMWVTEVNNHGMDLATMNYVTTISLSGAVSQRLCFFSACIKASGAVIHLITSAFIPQINLHTLFTV
jgi:hypothetical protein